MVCRFLPFGSTVRFVEATEVDCFAPAIGTAHGVYRGEPKIAYDRLERIARSCDTSRPPTARSSDSNAASPLSDRARSSTAR